MGLRLHFAKFVLGKYIIFFASLLHLFWAVMLMIDIRAANSTPISILFALFHYRLVVIGVLLIVSFSAGLFLDLRLRTIVHTRWLTLLLIPQQLILWCSAGAGIYATIIERYADGITRSWAHIGADQIAMVLTAMLYTVALLETTDP